MSSTSLKHLQSREAALAWMAEQNLTFVKGFHDASAPISARADVPAECSFSSRDTFWYYNWALPDGQTACYGWTRPTCGDGWWADPDWTDLQNAMNRLVAMDGWWSKAEVGKWTAQFGLFTTAFDNRDTTLYSLSMIHSHVKPARTWFSRNYDIAQNDRFPYCD
ncbi:hypothetical protein C8A01DRAFT_34481 [Parachaetomium inaequale]|uniref:Uncharacterized protein n=1 Tax=Parachaetomium inaequale TaxID=2588326 RepID=A0AAN6STK8_9PEZI|nr:hypothetical protein C8A01DRAFT_34481 [Parachaetomium inaequale]